MLDAARKFKWEEVEPAIEEVVSSVNGWDVDSLGDLTETTSEFAIDAPGLLGVAWRNVTGLVSLSLTGEMRCPFLEAVEFREFFKRCPEGVQMILALWPVSKRGAPNPGVVFSNYQNSRFQLLPPRTSNKESAGYRLWKDLGHSAFDRFDEMANLFISEREGSEDIMALLTGPRLGDLIHNDSRTNLSLIHI